jgi:antitoxin FitA
MAQLMVREVTDELVYQLRIRAARNKRSAEAEHRAILEQVLQVEPQAHPFWERAARLREATMGRNLSDSTEQIRADRDRDHKPQP